MSPLVVLGVAVAGGLGALARAETTRLVEDHGGSSRSATLLVNLAGTALLGLVHDAGTTTLLVVGGGFCGGLTTFSTWVVAAAGTLVTEHHPAQALDERPVERTGGTSGVATVVAGLVAVGRLAVALVVGVLVARVAGV